MITEMKDVSRARMRCVQVWQSFGTSARGKVAGAADKDINVKCSPSRTATTWHSSSSSLHSIRWSPRFCKYFAYSAVYDLSRCIHVSRDQGLQTGVIVNHICFFFFVHFIRLVTIMRWYRDSTLSISHRTENVHCSCSYVSFNWPHKVCTSSECIKAMIGRPIICFRVLLLESTTPYGLKRTVVSVSKGSGARW